MSPAPAGRESSIVVRPQPMDSATYTASSRLQAAGLRRGMALSRQAAASVPLPEPPAHRDRRLRRRHGLQLAAADRRRDHSPAHPHVPTTRSSSPTPTCRQRLHRVVLHAHRGIPDSYLARTRPPSPPRSEGRSTNRSCRRKIALGWSSWATHWRAGSRRRSVTIHIARSADEGRLARVCETAALTGMTSSPSAAENWPRWTAGGAHPGARRRGLPGFGGLCTALLAALQHLAGDGMPHPKRLPDGHSDGGRTETNSSRRSRRRDASRGCPSSTPRTVRRRRPVLVSLPRRRRRRQTGRHMGRVRKSGDRPECWPRGWTAGSPIRARLPSPMRWSPLWPLGWPGSPSR